MGTPENSEKERNDERESAEKKRERKREKRDADGDICRRENEARNREQTCIGEKVILLSFIFGFLFYLSLFFFFIYFPPLYLHCLVLSIFP